MLEKILVPLDGSPTAEAVLPHVGRLLRRVDAEVILLQSANPIPSADTYVPVAEAALAAAREYLLGIQQRLEGRGVKVRIITRLGSAADVIAEVARQEGVGAVAIATHGRSGVARLLLGSVAEHVLRTSPVPVLAVRPFWSYELAQPVRVEDAPVRNILVPLDGTLAILPEAARFARFFGARVVLLHVVDPNLGLTPRVRAGQGLADVAERFADTDLAKAELAEQAAWFRNEGVEVTTIVDVGNPARVIVDSCRFHEIDLIAMATHGRTGLSRLVMGSVTESVLRESKVPLVVVRSGHAAPKEGDKVSAAKEGH